MATPIATDYPAASEQAPIGLVISRQRLMGDCNEALAQMFRTPRELLAGRSLRCL